MKQHLRLIIIGVLLLVIGTALRANAHTAEELQEWETEWSSRAEDPYFRLTSKYLAEYVDMVERHQWYFAPQPVVVQVSSTNSDRTGSADMGNNVEQWRDLVSSYSWNVDIALCLMSHESGGNPNAQNGRSGASGLMQVLPSWASKFGYSSLDLFTPEVNLEISYALYVDGGWSHWSPWNRGECH